MSALQPVAAQCSAPLAPESLIAPQTRATGAPPGAGRCCLGWRFATGPDRRAPSGLHAVTVQLADGGSEALDLAPALARAQWQSWRVILSG